MRSIIPTMLLGPTPMPQVYGTPIYTGMFLGGPSGIWDSHIHMGAPYEKHYSYNASGPPRREPWALRPVAISLFPNFFVFKIVFRPATKDF